MTFGKRLAEMRKARKLSQSALGEGLGTDGANAKKSVVYGWEKDNHYPRVDQLVLICERLGCSADYLLWGRDAEWPFSPQLFDLVSKLDADARTTLENVMLAHLGRAAAPTAPATVVRRPLVLPKPRDDTKESA